MARFVQALALLLTVLCTALPADDLETSELARAMGVDWWTIQLPSDKGDDLQLGFSIISGDGCKGASGSMSGFRAGTRIKALCWPAEKSGLMNVSLVSETGVMRGTMAVPASRIGTYATPLGGVAKLGDVLWKRSTADTVTPDQMLREGDFGLSVVIWRPATKKQSPDTIDIDAKGNLKLNGEPIELDKLATALAGDKVVIRAARDVPYQHVVGVGKVLREAGKQNVFQMVAPEE